MYTNTLYSKDSSGRLRVWNITTNGNAVVVSHGLAEDGKISKKLYYAEGKNIGKVNETSPEAQADLEAEAKAVKQLKRGYFQTEAEALGSEDKTPMKLQQYKNYKHKIVYPALISEKLNGLRMLFDKDGFAQSKSGERYVLPQHIQHSIDLIRDALGDEWQGLDEEIYAGRPGIEGDLSLQDIVSAFRKPNENTQLLQYWVYDIPVSGKPYESRLSNMWSLERKLEELNIKNIVVLSVTSVNTEEEAITFFNEVVFRCGEGAVIRNFNGEYEFGKRSYDALKMKHRDTTEALVVDVSEDKNHEGVLSCELENGKKFKCKMLKDVDGEGNIRLYKNSLGLTQSYIEVEYEELSDDGIPTKPVGIRRRKVDVIAGEWVVKE